MHIYAGMVLIEVPLQVTQDIVRYRMEKCTTFVLSGGGSRGPLQVGAMRALLEAGIVPDLLVGTSIGAVNVARFG